MDNIILQRRRLLMSSGIEKLDLKPYTMWERDEYYYADGVVYSFHGNMAAINQDGDTKIYWTDTTGGYVTLCAKFKDAVDFSKYTRLRGVISQAKHNWGYGNISNISIFSTTRDSHNCLVPIAKLASFVSADRYTVITDYTIDVDVSDYNDTYYVGCYGSGGGNAPAGGVYIQIGSLWLE